MALTRSLCTSLGLCLTALCAAPARADEPAPAAEEGSPASKQGDGDAGLEVVVTGTRAVENRSRAVVRVDVVTRAEARRRGATNVAEAVSGELGAEVNPSAYGALGRPSAAQLGGLDRDRVLVLEDGERVVGDFGGAIDLSKTSLAAVSRVELIQGPTSALYGSSAMGGVINVISAPPEREGWSGRVSAEGRHRWGGAALGELSYRDAGLWASSEASFYGSTGVSLAPPDTALPDLYRLDVGLRVGAELGRHELTARVRYGREAAMGLDSQQVPGLGTFLVDLPERTDRVSLRLRERLVLGQGHDLTLSASKQWFWNETGRDRQGSDLDEIRERFHTMHALEATGSFFQGQWGSFLVGARGEVESFHQALRRATFASGEVTTSELSEVPPTQLGGGAGYGQVRFDPWDELSVVGGARVEGSARYGVAVAPRLAVAVRPLESLTLRVSGGRGYRAPSAKEVGFTFDHSAFGYQVLGNPELSPESSWGFQADVVWRVDRRLELKASGFANWVTDLIDLRLADVPSGVAGVDAYQYANVGEARTSGASAGVRARAGEWVRVEAGYSYLFTRDEAAQRPLPGRPPHTLLVSATVDTPIGLSLYGRLRGVLDAYLEDTLRAPAFATLDLRVAQRTWPGGSAFLGVLNLLGVQKDAGRPGDQRPIEGRTFYLGVEAELPPES